MPDNDTEQWNVEYYSLPAERMSKAVLDIPSGAEIDELSIFPGVDSDTGDPVSVRYYAGEWSTVPEFEFSYLGVSCDAPQLCDTALRGDFKVRGTDGRAARLGCILDYAAAAGWRIEGREDPFTAKAFCPRHSSTPS